MSEPAEPIPAAARVRNLPRYLFATIFQMRDEALAAGRQVFDLGVGNPDSRPPAHVLRALVECLDDPDYNCHRYGSFQGLDRLREAAAAWYATRFGVAVDPAREVLPLIGTKEGLANLMRAYLDPGDTVIIPSPCYPAYFGAARLCEADIFELALREGDGFLPRLGEIPPEVADRAKLLLLNYPNNPTGGVCELDLYREAVAFCRRHRILLASDLAYGELSLEPDYLPASVLQVREAREVAVEFQSLSKSHCMAGWRVGFAVGNAGVLASLMKVKSNVDFSVFGAVQVAAAAALEGSQEVCAENRLRYRRRRDRMVETFHGLGWRVPVPRAAMYLWSRIPRAFGDDDFEFVRVLFARTGVLLSPGSGFGSHGQGYVRASLGVADEELERALAGCRAADISWAS